jgi:hypothetical protein
MMQSTNQLDQAMKIAAEAHEGQTDKLGNPYVEHCLRVASKVSDEERKIVAYLHDVLEKRAEWTFDRLRQQGFSAPVLTAVDALTRRPDEDEDSFIHRAVEDDLARPVKQADLEDNLWQVQRIGGDADNYRHGLEILANATTHSRQEWTGGCLCGGRRYRFRSAPRYTGYCHCNMCRRATGGPFAVLVQANISEIEWTAPPAWYRSSPIARRGFCPDCGTPLFLQYDDSEFIRLTAGTLDHPDRITPAGHYGVESRLAWADCGPGLPEEATKERF